MAEHKQMCVVEASSEYVGELNDKLKRYEDELRLLKMKLAEAFMENASDASTKDVEMDLGASNSETAGDGAADDNTEDETSPAATAAAAA